MKNNSLGIRLLLPALTCLSISSSESLYNTINSNIMPSKTINCNFYDDNNYYIDSQILSNKTEETTDNHNNFKIIYSFAEKILNNSEDIGKEFQDVINDNFWDML